MIRFKTIIKKFNDRGEKTGWTYIEISADLASQLKKQKKSFAVKGFLDHSPFKQISLLPIGNGVFILALNARLRKTIGKRKGDAIEVKMEIDECPYRFSEDLILCLSDEPASYTFFNSLTYSHQKYFSKWIEAAKTTETRTKRILVSVRALSQRKSFQLMMQENKKVIE